MNNDIRMALYDAKIVRGNIEKEWRELYAKWKVAAANAFQHYKEHLRSLDKSETYDEWHERVYRAHDADMEVEELNEQQENIRAEWRKADDEVQRLKALNERKYEPQFAVIDFMYALSMKQWPQHGYKLIHENGGEYWTQDYPCACPDKIPANRRSKALLSEPSLLKERNEDSA